SATDEGALGVLYNPLPRTASRSRLGKSSPRYMAPSLLAQRTRRRTQGTASPVIHEPVGGNRRRQFAGGSAVFRDSSRTEGGWSRTSPKAVERLRRMGSPDFGWVDDRAIDRCSPSR